MSSASARERFRAAALFCKAGALPRFEAMGEGGVNIEAFCRYLEMLRAIEGQG